MKARPEHYDIIRRPIVTEKSVQSTQGTTIVIEVAPRATKAQIKEAVEAVLGLEVVRVNTLRMKGKRTSQRGSIKAGRRKNWKKAYVRLVEGQSAESLFSI